MNGRGQRVLFDKPTGAIVSIVGEMWGEGNLPSHTEITELAFIDLPFGYVGDGGYIESIDPETNEPIVKVAELTEEQKRIKGLEEDVLLLQTENEIGGIL